MPSNRHPDAAAEQRLLKLSLIAVLVMGILSILFGLWSGSDAITFDGFFNLADASMTLVALLVAKLIARGHDDRFQFGYWHLEPLLGLVSGVILAITCIYAFTDGVRGLMTGKAPIDFGPGAVFAGVLAAVSIGMYFFIRHSARNTDSEFLRIDARGWLMGGILSSAFCVSFVIGSALVASPLSHLTPYVDPAVLVLAALGLSPFPVITIWKAGTDILQIAPADLSERAQDVARTIAEKHGFKEFTSHVSRAGRQQFVEIGLVASSASLTKSFEELDQIREEISAAMGGSGPGCWLTVDFTADKRWI